MKLSLYLLAGLISSVGYVNSYADSFQPLPHCYKPSQPLWLASESYKARYKRDVTEYQDCMKAFIVEQERAVKIHTQAAQQALKTWNDFAKDN